MTWAIDVNFCLQVQTHTHTHTHTNACRGTVEEGKKLDAMLVAVIKFTNPNLKPTKSLKVGGKNKSVPRKYFELSLLSNT